MSKCILEWGHAGGCLRQDLDGGIYVEGMVDVRGLIETDGDGEHATFVSPVEVCIPLIGKRVRLTAREVD